MTDNTTNMPSKENTTPAVAMTTNQIIHAIGKIRKRAKEPEMIEMKTFNKALYQTVFEKEYPEFSEDYPTLFRKVIMGEDLSMLAQMLYMMEKINSNKIDKDAGERIVGETLAKKYVYPVVEDIEKIKEKDKNAHRAT